MESLKRNKFNEEKIIFLVFLCILLILIVIVVALIYHVVLLNDAVLATQEVQQQILATQEAQQKILASTNKLVEVKKSEVGINPQTWTTPPFLYDLFWGTLLVFWLFKPL